jgi:hypothetical protein
LYSSGDVIRVIKSREAHYGRDMWETRIAYKIILVRKLEGLYIYIYKGIGWEGMD